MGSCAQTIQLKADCPYTYQAILNGLNCIGELAISTTLHENGSLILFGKDSRVLGTITSSVVDAEYTDFETV